LWRLKVSADVCLTVDSCLGQYTFINDGVGKGEKITFAQAWQGKSINKINNDQVSNNL